nr:MAG TPA: hypothetical protein [Inoviridae sp.]
MTRKRSDSSSRSLLLSRSPGQGTPASGGRMGRRAVLRRGL